MTDVQPHEAAGDLEASIPLDPERGLRGEAGQGIVEHVLALMAAREARVRALTADAARQRGRTVEAFLSNLVVAALNRINPDRYVAVPFNRSAYAKLGLSYDAMTLARDTLIELGLIEYRAGFYRRHFIEFREFRRVSRIRATAALRDVFDDFDVRRRSVTNQRERLIKLNNAEDDAGPEPKSLAESRAILSRVNARIEASDIGLSDEAWEVIAQRRRQKAKEDNPYAAFEGDLTAKALRRVFTGNWDRGGRLYGGWWQSVDSDMRPRLTIDREPTVEIDIAHIHPALLYRAVGKRLDRDPYCLPPYSRDLCKETFQRLINRKAYRGGADIKRPAKFKPPADIPFATFLADYKRHLSAVSDCFGKSVGLLLQREDSELALAILDTLDRAGVTTLPIHDSFMVQLSQRETLERTMREIYRSRYKVQPELKTILPAYSGLPGTP